MPFTNTNDYLTGRNPPPTPAGGEVVATRFAIDLVAADLDNGDAGFVGILPAGCVPVTAIVDSDDLDTNGAPTIAMSLGLLNAGATAIDGTAWATGINISRTGGSVQVDLAQSAMRMAPSNADRKFGLVLTAAAATKAAGQVGVTLLYRAP